MLVPVVLLFFATLTASVMAYGTNAGWAQYSHGYEFILWSRRVQWPLVVISLGLCLSMFGLIISGRRRAWWLIGLAPVMALFIHRFVSDPINRFQSIEDPVFVAAKDVKFVADEDWVIGYRFAEVDYACPFSVLFEKPVVIHADHDRRVVVMWSAYANRALAVEIGRDLRGSDLEVVSMPANALLVYNSRLGQFINGLTGLTPSGKKPDGFREPISTVKTTWKAWRTKYPETKVLQPLAPASVAVVGRPIRPTNPLPQSAAAATPVDSQVAIVGVASPIAIPAESITNKPLNISVDDAPVLMFRDPTDLAPRAFERRVDDLRPRFRLNTDLKKHPKAAFVDEDTGAGWDLRGVAIDGPPTIRGKRLKPVAIEDGLSLRVMKYWYPQLKVLPAP